MYKWLLLLIIFIGSGSVYSQDSGFGAGIVLGDPTGISLKSWTTATNAWDAGLAWDFRGEGNLYLQAGYLWHKYDMIRVRTGRLPVYYGVGGRLLLSGENRIGIRGSVGLNYHFSGAPVDAFLEIAPVLDFVPETDLGINGGIGVRYFF